MNFRFFLSALASAAFVVVLGCSDDGLGKRYSVSGTVTYKGQPVPKAVITFLPVEPNGRGGTGEIRDGSFKMMTQSPGDGMFPGTYSATITALSVDFTSADDETKTKAEKSKANNYQQGMPDQAAVAKAYKSAANAVPAKYAQIATSGLKFEIKAESKNLKIELTD